MRRLVCKANDGALQRIQELRPDLPAKRTLCLIFFCESESRSNRILLEKNAQDRKDLLFAGFPVPTKSPFNESAALVAADIRNGRNENCAMILPSGKRFVCSRLNRIKSQRSVFHIEVEEIRICSGRAGFAEVQIFRCLNFIIKTVSAALKPVASIADIGTLLNAIPQDKSLEAYDGFTALQEMEKRLSSEMIGKSLDAMELKGREDRETLLMTVFMLILESNCRRQLAEKLIDKYFKE